MPPGILDSIGSGLQSVGQGATNVLMNPLVQGALGAYLGAVSTPRYEGLGGAIGRGGLEGLGAMSQAQQAQYQLPILQAQAQQAKAQLAPLSPHTIDQLNNLVGQSKDPQEQAFFSYLKDEYQNRRLSDNDLVTAIEKWNEPKRLADYWKSVASQQGANLTQAVTGQLTGGGMGTPTLNAGPMSIPLGGMPGPSPSATPPPPGAPAGSATAGGTSTDPPWANYKSLGPAGTIYFDASDGHWYTANPDGSKGPPVS